MVVVCCTCRQKGNLSANIFVCLGSRCISEKELASHILCKFRKKFYLFLIVLGKKKEQQTKLTADVFYIFYILTLTAKELTEY